VPQRLLSSIFAGCLLTGGLLGAQQLQPTSLPNSPRPLSIQPGGRAVFAVPAAAGDYVHLAIDRESLDVDVRLVAPDDTPVNISDRLRAQTYTDLLLLLDQRGTYRLEMAVIPSATGPRVATASRVVQRQATAIDHQRLAADAAVVEAARLQNRGTAESRKAAIAGFQDAIAKWQAAADDRGAADAANRLGQVYYTLGDLANSADTHMKAAAWFESAGDRRGVGEATGNAGVAYRGLGKLDDALRAQQLALDVARELSNQKGQAYALHNLGAVYYARGEYAEALAHYEQAVTIKRAIGDRTVPATLSNVAATKSRTGLKREALATYEEVAALRRAQGDRAGEANDLHNIGTTLIELEEWEPALASLRQALPLFEASGNRIMQGHALHNLGMAYSRLGDRTRATDYYTRALALRRDIGDPATIGTTLQNLGAVYLIDGDYARAQTAITEALDYKRRGSDRFGEASALGWLVRLEMARGDLSGARGHAETALKLSRDVGDPVSEAAALLQLASLAFQQEDLPTAAARAGEALALNRAVHNRTNEASTLFLLATIDARQGNLSSASERLEIAIAAVEAVRAKAPTPELRSSYLADHQRYFDLAVDVLMRRHAQTPDANFATQALAVTERGRARRLLEMLAEARVDLSAGNTATDLQAERAAVERLELREAERTRLSASRASSERIAAAQSGVTEALDALTTIRDQLKRTQPQFASLTMPGPLPLTDIQQRLLDPDTVLLDFWTGPDRSYLWIVSPSGVRVHTLPARGQLEASVRRVLELVTSRQERVRGETPAAARARIAAADAALPALTSSLSDTLFAPVLRDSAARRWLIVPDGPLEYLPFGLLPIRGRTGAAMPLAANREFVVLPSASALATVRAGVTAAAPPPKAIAVFADPVFSADDVRVNAPATSAPARTDEIADALRSARDLGLEFPRLTFSRAEADAIAALAPPQSTMTATDFDASRDAAAAGALRDFGILHFATHAVVNTEQPEMSGIVLSLVDPNGRPQNGFLRLYDIYALRLRSRLVVLSACQTAVGKQIRGDGLAGLSRGFMFAGASGVLASLWRVDDRATSALMQRFYRGLLSGGLSPAAAWRAAVSDLRADPRWSAPYYWAGFVLQGEWR